MPLRILNIIQRTQLRGAEIFAAQLSQHLSVLGHTVKILALMDGGAKLPFDGDIAVLGVKLTKRMMDVRGWRQLAVEIERFAPDVVQANAGDTLKYASLSKLLFRWKGKLIYRNANKVSDFLNSRAKLYFNSFMLRQVDYVISVSETCRLDFISTYGFNHARTLTLPIGIEGSPMITNLPADMLKLVKNSSIVLNVASLVPEKNQITLIPLAKKLSTIDQNIRILIVGDGKMRVELERAIQDEGLSDKIVLLGYRTEVLELMRHAKLLIVPSLVEGLPGVILEAFSVGLPVVAYGVGGIGEVVQNGRTGWLVRKGDEEGLFEGVRWVLDNPHKAREMSANASQLVSSRYLNNAIAHRFVEVYQSLQE